MAIAESMVEMMAKSSIPADNYPLQLIGFYTRHARVSERNEIVNPVTGEISHPPTMTKQEFRDQCDINNIIKEFSISGQVNHMAANAARGAYIDLPDDLDFQNSLNTVIRAREAFESLPSQVRNRFQGDPAQFLAFVQDPGNADELVTMGLRQRPPRAPETAARPSGGDGGTPPSPTPAPAPGEAPGGSQAPSGGQAR